MSGYLWRGPYVKVPWAMQDDPIWRNDRALARWLRSEVEADKDRRRRRRWYVPPAVWEPILRAFGYRCAYCGRSDVPLEKDHRVPVSRGGTEDPTNLVPACKPCNVRKSNHDPAGWPLLVEPGS